MEFCPKCGSVLVEKGKALKCAHCSYTSKAKATKLKVSEKIEEKQDIGIVKKRETDVFPVIAATCTKCGNKEAYFWTSQTRAGDEAETRFFKCTKCEYTWREYH
jgi:DNA-directed RNA polymerase subunit M